MKINQFPPGRYGIFQQSIISLLILMWSYAAVSKLLELDKNRTALEPLFGHLAAAIIAIAVPVAEALVVVLLIGKRYRVAGVWLSLLLLVNFTGYIALVLGNAFTHHPCSCGGLLQRMSWRQHLVFNLAVMALHLPFVFPPSRAGAIFFTSRKEVTNS